jgi:hypothetical protein
MKTAFLHNDVVEGVYMDPPLGFILEKGKTCKLKKALYELK